jgi:hypothetical protein
MVGFGRRRVRLGLGGEKE